MTATALRLLEIDMRAYWFTVVLAPVHRHLGFHGVWVASGLDSVPDLVHTGDGTEGYR